MSERRERGRQRVGASPGVRDDGVVTVDGRTGAAGGGGRGLFRGHEACCGCSFRGAQYIHFDSGFGESDFFGG